MTSHVRSIRAGVALVLTLGIDACNRPRGTPEPLPAAASASAKRYTLRGMVVATDPARMQITVAHNAIDGYMPAMTMPFNLRDPRPVKSAKRGQFIDATLVVDGEYSWLEKGALRPGTSIALEQVESVSAGARPGDEVPDFTLVNQDNAQVSIKALRGKAVALTFIYLQCPLPDFCPLMTKNFAGVEREAIQKPELAARTQLLSVTFDPKNDTPELLKKYAATYMPAGAPANHWQFLTGSEDNIQAITTFFGLTYDRATDQIRHSLRTVVIRPDGRIAKVYIGNDWRPAEVVEDLAAAARTARPD